MNTNNKKDWEAAISLLKNIPQDQHPAYLDMMGMLSSKKQEAKEGLTEVSKNAKASKERAAKKTAAPKPKKSTKIKYNDVELTERQWHAFTCARSLIRSRDELIKETGIEGFNQLSAKTMLMYMGEVATHKACDSLNTHLREVKRKGLLDWEVETVEKGYLKIKANFRLGLNA